MIQFRLLPLVFEKYYRGRQCHDILEKVHVVTAWYPGRLPSTSILRSAFASFLSLSFCLPTDLPSLKTKSEMMSKGWMWTADRIMVTVFCGSLEASEMVC